MYINKYNIYVCIYISCCEILVAMTRKRQGSQLGFQISELGTRNSVSNK